MKTNPWIFATLFSAVISWTTLLLAQSAVILSNASPQTANASSTPVAVSETDVPTESVTPSSVTAPTPVAAMPTASVPCNECAQGVAMEGYGRGPRRGPLVESYSKYYNCKYHGSYNHPVPPQFTYFWPGLYKQKSIADYQGVYRNTMLISPAEVFNPNAVINVPAAADHQTIMEP